FMCVMFFCFKVQELNIRKQIKFPVLYFVLASGSREEFIACVSLIDSTNFVLPRLCKRYPEGKVSCTCLCCAASRMACLPAAVTQKVCGAVCPCSSNPSVRRFESCAQSRST